MLILVLKYVYFRHRDRTETVHLTRGSDTFIGRDARLAPAMLNPPHPPPT